MSWVGFAFLAVGTWSVVNIIDKLVMTHYFKTPLLPSFVGALAGLVFFSGIGFFYGYDGLTLVHVLLALAAGALTLGASFLYFHAIAREEISRVVPLLYFVPLFVSVLAAIFLGEVFAPYRYFGITLLVAGAALLTYRGRMRPGLPAAFILVAAFGWAIASVVEKYLLTTHTVWTIIGLVQLGFALGYLPFYRLAWRELRVVRQRAGWLPLVVSGGSEVLDFIALAFMFTAFALGPVTLVSSLTVAQPVFVFLLSLGFSIWLPQMLREHFSFRVILQKVVAISIMVAGALLVI